MGAGRNLGLQVFVESVGKLARYKRFDLLRRLFRVGMSPKDLWRCLAVRSVRQNLHTTYHRAWIVTSKIAKPHAPRIRLVFVLATILHLRELGSGLRHACALLTASCHTTGCRQALEKLTLG